MRVSTSLIAARLAIATIGVAVFFFSGCSGGADKKDATNADAAAPAQSSAVADTTQPAEAANGGGRKDAVPAENSAALPPSPTPSNPAPSNPPPINPPTVAAPSPEPPPAKDIEPPGLEVDSGAASKATSAYLDGLEALAAAKWKPAAEAFSAAIDAADSDVPEYYRARGIALALAEQLPAAIKDLRRASQLDPAARETRVWLAAAVGMSGDPMQASEIYPPATLDPYETFVGQMRVDYGQLLFFQKRGDVDPRFVAQHAAALGRFAQAGAWYAGRMKSTPELTQALWRRAKQRFAAGQFAAAQADLDDVQPKMPDDMAVLFYHAGCLLAAGEPERAWEEYTQILTKFTAFGRGYGYRAQAAAMLGDGRRASANLDSAAALRPQDAARFQTLVTQQLATVKADAPTGKPAVLRAALEKAALDGAPLNRLTEQAATLIRAIRATRLNDDEVYQQRLKELEDALRAEPNNLDRQVALAEFLTREAQKRYERMAPPAQFALLQPEIPSDPEGEFARAQRLADQALAANPQSAKALVAKARLDFAFHQFADADRLLQQALAIERTVPDGLEMWARVLTVGASQAADRAVNLETPQSGTNYGYDSIIYWTRYPSAEELRQAAQFREIAKERREQARQIFEEAVKLRPSDATGYFDLGTWRLGQGDLPGAQQVFEKATQLDPQFVAAHQALAKVYSDQGMTDKAYQEQSLVANQTEGAVSGLLAQAWQDMSRTALKNATKSVTQAALADPADARVPAYLAIVQLANDKADAGPAEFRMAVALEAARLSGVIGAAGNAGAGRVDPDDVALLMMLRIRAADVEAPLASVASGAKAAPPAADRAAIALQLAQDNLALEKRLPVVDQLRKLPTSVLPIVGANVAHRQQPECPSSLIAWSHIQAGAALVAMRRTDEAAAQFQAAYQTGRGMPNIMGMEPLMAPRFRAGLALVQLLMQNGNANAARQLLDKISGEANSRELFDEAQKVRNTMFGQGGR